ncbi:MAG: BREX-3 system phosphatase PglZ [Chloroflexi bacterium]|nr:BREX-3 system phosphatase PglZ [Chloroflexota bacterium]
MASLRRAILRELASASGPLRLVADPDEMLLEAELIEAIHDLGYKLITFEDPISFRFIYEQHLRDRPEDGAERARPVLVRWPSADLEQAPFDLLRAGRKATFGLSGFFPDLSYSVVTALEPEGMERLYAAQEAYPPGRMGKTKTKEYVLRHVFEIAVELLKEPSDLFQALLKRHYSGERIPNILDDHLISRLRRNPAFNEWPLELIIPNRDAFFAFVQERWPVFLDRKTLSDPKAIRERMAHYAFQFPGAADLPFDDADVRIYIDNLFAEGFLEPVSYAAAEEEDLGWPSVGIAVSPPEDRKNRINGLMESIHASIPEADARYSDWTGFALLWARLIEAMANPPNEEATAFEEQVTGLRLKIDLSFTEWLTEHYWSLIQLPPSPPVMLHHLPRFLARVRGSANDPRIAFLLLDGLSLDQWLTLKKALREQDSHLIFEDSLVFAWIPTITSVSRQAAFSGKLPAYFPTSIHTTSKEATLWAEFWAGEGLAAQEVVYERGLRDGDLNELMDRVSNPSVRMVGLVVDMVDKIMHGMELGTPGMHNQISQWARGGFLLRLITSLLDLGFFVYLGSDHGNIEATGLGNPKEGAVAELRGTRARVYPSELLRRQVSDSYPESIEWPSIGLPEDYIPLIAPNRMAFVRQSERIVGHGGITLEEVIVPFVSIGRSANGSK